MADNKVDTTVQVAAASTDALEMTDMKNDEKIGEKKADNTLTHPKFICTHPPRTHTHTFTYSHTAHLHIHTQHIHTFIHSTFTFIHSTATPPYIQHAHTHIHT